MKRMKRIMIGLVCGLFFIAGSALACEQGTNCVPAPTPAPNCGTPDCNGSSYTGGNFHVVLNGMATATGAKTNVFSGGQYDYRAKVGDESNGININSIGGYLTEDKGRGWKTVGGKTIGTGNWGTYSQW